MKFILLLISIFLSFALKGIGQISYSQKVRLFTDSIFSGTYIVNKKLIIAEMADSSMYTDIREKLKTKYLYKRQTYSKGKKAVIDTFQLTTEELNYADSFLRAQSNTVWTEEFINNAIFVPKKKVDELFSGQSKDDDFYLLKTYGDSRIFFLSKPVFLRNDTICIFEKDMDCGFLCGGGDLTIYRKENDRWIRYRILFGWVE